MLCRWLFVFSEVRVTRSLVLCVCFVDHCLSRNCLPFRCTWVHPHFSEVRVTRSLVLCVCFVDHCLGSCYSIFSFMCMFCRSLFSSCYSIFSFMCMFCRSLFALLYFFFWSIVCLFFFDIRILITPFLFYLKYISLSIFISKERIYLKFTYSRC